MGKGFKIGFPMVCYVGIFLFSFLIAMPGCVSRDSYLRQTTSGQIGCPPEEITIEDTNTIGGLVSGYTAKCKGRTFYCSSMTSGIFCKEAAK
jgi:hypothetical protein